MLENAPILNVIVPELKKEIVNHLSTLDSHAHIRAVSTVWKKAIDDIYIVKNNFYFEYLKKTQPQQWENNPFKLFFKEFEKFLLGISDSIPDSMIFASLNGDFERVNALPDIHPVDLNKLYAISYANGGWLPENVDGENEKKIKSSASIYITITGNINFLPEYKWQGNHFSQLARNGHLEAIKELQPIWNDKTHTKKMILSNASRYGHLAIVEYVYPLLPANEMQISYSCGKFFYRNNNPLYDAAKNGHLEVVKFFLYKKANGFTEDINNAMAIAEKNKHAEIFNVLKKYQEPIERQFAREMTRFYLSILGGVITAIALNWTIMTTVMSIAVLFFARKGYKKYAYDEYNEKSAEELDVLSPDLRKAFEQGVKSNESYWEHAKSYNPLICPAANLHWKAYYAGRQASQMSDNKLIEKVNVRRLMPN